MWRKCDSFGEKKLPIIYSVIASRKSQMRFTSERRNGNRTDS